MENLSVGYKWNSANGVRTIAEIDSALGRIYVGTEGIVFHDIYTSEADVLKRQEIDAANIAYRAKCHAEQAEREEKEAAAIKPLTDYLDTLTPMKAGLAKRSLERVCRWPTGHCESRWKAIIRLLNSGYVADETGLEAPNESFFDQSALTSHGINFALFHQRD